jgi:flagellar protein FliS
MERPRGFVNNNYLKVKIETATPIELVVIAYDGCIQYLKKALDSYELHRRSAYDDGLVRARKFIIQLQVSLDLSVKPLSGQLYGLYDYMKRLLTEALCNRRESKPKIEKVLTMMQELRDTWDKIRQKAPVEKDKRSLEPLSMTM